MKWADITGYAHGKRKQPTSWGAQCGWFLLVVAHSKDKGLSARCYPLFDDVRLHASTLDNAKVEAATILRGALTEALRAIDV